ncbi:MAG: GNAT family N-acetyltransferase, partial [Brevundimonas sp.]
MTTTKRQGGARRLVQRLGGLVYELTPQIFAVASFILGAVMLLSAVTPAFSGRLQVLGQVTAPLLI